MNKDEFKRQISKIQTAYNKIFTKQEMTVWYEEFKNTDKDFQKYLKKQENTEKSLKDGLK